ncbi:putative DsbA family dithiol-disulfide isomerase [Alkalibacillus flavidus]|uniref:DsbA family dithiol-disulfide isomerase n=1 Tax=Alkalibacillus flavidus TaxID=546021 RepID=A0ABV2KTC2_9BACI
MKVEIWSDVVCPFCYIGKRRFEAALEQFEAPEKVSVAFKSFQLDPTVQPGQYNDIHEMLATKYQVPYEQGREMNQQMAEQAREVGLTFNMDAIIPTNTKDAQRLIQFAKQEGKGNELTDSLMQAYFTEGLDVSDETVLGDRAEAVGLNRDEALNALQSGAFNANVSRDIQDAGDIGVQGVPFFVFNEKYAVSGAQPIDTFTQVLEKVYEEEKQEPKLQMMNTQSTTEYCDDESCQ